MESRCSFYGIEYVARPLCSFSSSGKLTFVSFRYPEIDFCGLGSGVGVDTAYPRHGYAISSLMDTAYWLSE
ncbi:hypothetical protein Tco_1298179 [Tanacetum coccineum]